MIFNRTAKRGLDRSKTLFIYNTNSSLNGASKARVDYYSSNRTGHNNVGNDIPTNGDLAFSIGFDFGTTYLTNTYAKAHAFSGQNLSALPAIESLLCTASSSPTLLNPVDNYVGLDLFTAIARIVQECGIQMIIVDSLVPALYGPFGTNYIGGIATSYIGQSPDCIFSQISGINALGNTGQNNTNDIVGVSAKSRPKILYAYDNTSGVGVSNRDRLFIDTRKPIVESQGYAVPYGTLGFPGCTLTDIQRMVADANLSETTNNLSKYHLVGGTAYLGGGDLLTTQKANAYFSSVVPLNKLGYFNHVAGTWHGTAGVIDWNSHWNAGGPSHLPDPSPPKFGALFSENPSQYAYEPTHNFLQGGWAFDWGSGAITQGLVCLKNGGCSAIFPLNEPYATGLPAIDTVAQMLLEGFSMAEAVFFSSNMSAAKTTVWGVPDYCPYKATPIKTTSLL